MSSPKCFISYSWDSDAHKEWVRNLAEHLQRSDVAVLLDQWDLRPGSDLPNYIETSVRESHFVILVCTPVFAMKANAGIGGVGYEKSVVTGELFHRISSPEKFVPILRSGSIQEAIPSYLKSKIYVDFRDDQVFQRSLEVLLRHFHNVPPYLQPSQSSKPSIIAREGVSSGTSKRIVYCSRCGAMPGQRSVCIGLSTAHNFVSGKDIIYCSRCGTVPGERSECIGLFTVHNFVSGTGSICCSRCGAVPGEKSECTGLFRAHDFVAVY
jgi:hypothetical protein